jgi:hypothetical protein
MQFRADSVKRPGAELLWTATICSRYGTDSLPLTGTMPLRGLHLSRLLSLFTLIDCVCVCDAGSQGCQMLDFLFNRISDVWLGI